MENINYQIKGFKCFTDKTFNLKNITLLTGSNGTGKSSFIQALLLIRSAIEKNCLDRSKNDYTNLMYNNIPIALNGPFELNLGSIYDIFNDDEDSSNKIAITIGEEEFSIEYSEDSNIDDVVSIKLEGQRPIENTPFWRKQEFYYLNTERLGPRLGIDSIHTDFNHCYFRGENTAKILCKYGIEIKVTDERYTERSKSPNLQQQVDAWLSEICPGTVGVKAEPQGPNRYQISMTTSVGRTNRLATNIGFGISYALPIIVNGLIAKKDSVFIVENPEAHLHPKGQSNMGFFLGMVAASGVRLIIETHSEHIVNGIRRASLQNTPLLPENIGIYFFSDRISKENNETKEILINTKGDLEDFPKDFFDQVSQDMAKLFKLKMTKNG